MLRVRGGAAARERASTPRGLEGLRDESSAVAVAVRVMRRVRTGGLGFSGQVSYHPIGRLYHAMKQLVGLGEFELTTLCPRRRGMELS